LRLRHKKPGYPLQSFLPLRGKKGFPLLSLARAPAATPEFPRDRINPIKAILLPAFFSTPRAKHIPD
jgi:hypothetical protein